jgi:hypothetical protein
MCLFSGEVEVADTRIFARVAKSGWQALVYEMTYRAAEPVAMVLPVPVLREEATNFRFCDLSDMPNFFELLDNAIPKTMSAAFGSEDVLRQPLAVERVGSFEASYVPSVADFARVDRRFRLSADVWKKLPHLKDWGFAVFQLADADAPQHPMAFGFRTREPNATFFPTVHVHDRTVPATAHFAHALYMQGPRGSRHAWGTWEYGSEAGRVMDVSRTQGIVMDKQPVLRRRVHGMLPNTDIWDRDER